MVRKLLLAALCLVALMPGRATAVRGIGLTPALQEVTLKEGQPTAEFKVELANTTADSVELELSAVDFGALDESGGVAFLGRSGQEAAPRGLKAWMRFSPDRLTLGPGDSEEITVSIDNRDDLSPGGHYGAVIVSVATGQGSSDDVAVVPAASTLVLLKKLGGENFDLKLDSIKANSSFINLPRDVSLRFNNAGNTHVVPRGTVTLESPTGSIVYRAVINESSSFVLPDSHRILESRLDNAAQPWLPGRYKLTITWRYDGTEQTSTLVTHHWYIGKLVIYTLFVLCTLLVLIMYVQYRRRPITRN